MIEFTDDELAAIRTSIEVRLIGIINHHPPVEDRLKDISKRIDKHLNKSGYYGITSDIK